MNPGFILIDKPSGITSFDVVARLRRLTGVKRIGHAGTLDPFATGLLLVGIGREATREMQKLVGLDKTYDATFVLGASSTTDDATGTIATNPNTTDLPQPPLCKEGGPRHLPLAKGEYEGVCKDALKSFVGEIDQVPPTYAAIKVNGKKLYELARAGNPTLVEPRRVTIYSIELEDPSCRQDDAKNNFPSLNDLTTQRLTLHIHCSSGTYIRSIARDLGAKLGIGGYVETLRRTSIGPFSIDESSALDRLDATTVADHIIKIDDFLGRLT
jgi:tRNA pseudouridine55 synthase